MTVSLWAYCRNQQFQFLLVQETALTMTLVEADHPTAEIWLAVTSSRILTLKTHVGPARMSAAPPLIPLFCFPSPPLWKSLPALGCEDGLRGRSLLTPEWVTFLLTSTCLRGLAFITADSQLLVSVTWLFPQKCYDSLLIFLHVLPLASESLPSYMFYAFGLWI